jgi:hypothetical protein
MSKSGFLYIHISTPCPDTVSQSANPIPARGGWESQSSPRPNRTRYRALGSLGSGTKPHSLPTACQRGCRQREDDPHLTVEVEAKAPTLGQAILAGRATSVPFTAVLTGPERTTTDNATVASTCAVPFFAAGDPARSGFGSRGSEHVVTGRM